MRRPAQPLDFVLVLHTHVPYVMRHGRWPHGSDWLMEAAVDSYLPFLDSLDRLGAAGVPAPVTVGVTPVVGAQLRDAEFGDEFRRFLAQRLDACDADERQLTSVHDTVLADVVRYWRGWYAHAAAQFDALGGDIVGALRSHEEAGRIEIMSSAATHGFLPLLARDESIRLQLLVGRAEHERTFGRTPAGCWLPECAYRPAGAWAPLDGVSPRHRAGIETHVENAGYRYVVVDAHLARAGRPFEAYAAGRRMPQEQAVERSPYGDYSIGAGPRALRALVRDPVTTRQVWSRDGGYPGAGPYLEFHKMRFPGGLRLWSVTGAGVSLGDKQPYHRAVAVEEARTHAHHFATLLGDISRAHHRAGEHVIVAPFDAELFGHWWFEGPDFLEEVYRELQSTSGVAPATASAHIAKGKPTPLDLPAGSWGRDGDFGFWLNEQTEWMWRRMWTLEDRFWTVAPAALAHDAGRVVLAQAARELLLAQSSDWEFMISAREVPDYGALRFTLHADDADTLIAAMEKGGDLDRAARLAATLAVRDSVFPAVLDSVARVVNMYSVAAA